VTISRAFYLQKTEVTQGQWQAVMGSNPSYFSNCGLSCPVESVSRDDIQAFIAQLNASSGVTYRLPTEAEWEYAARAGTTGETYGALDSIAWHPGNAGGGTHPSAGKQANAWGLYDMIGNVFEWVNDWFAAYSSTPVTDPTGPATGSDVAERGGGWYAGYLGQTPWRYIVWARAAARGRSSPASRSFELGFRLARTP
jgi:formylglycine-generating enzyme required for sulfatase activity